MSKTPAPYVCPDCGWECVPAGSSAEEIVRCAVEIEKHLLAVHDRSFRSTNATADAWTDEALNARPRTPKS